MSSIADGGHSMPISIFLEGQKFDPETKRIMGVAFEMRRAALQLRVGFETHADRAMRRTSSMTDAA